MHFRALTSPESPYHEGDISLMEAANKAKLTSPKLEGFHHTRLFLRVQYLSESPGDGIHIASEYWNIKNQSLHQDHWAFQPFLTMHSIKIRRNF